MTSVNPQSIKAVARKDFQDAVRSYLFLGLSLLFFTVLVTPTIIFWHAGDDLPTGTEDVTMALFGAVSSGVILIVPLIAIVLGWKSIAGERQSGSIKVMLSLPHSRTDVLLGKLVGRSGVLSLSLVIGFVLAAVVVRALLGSFYLTDFTALLLFSVVLGVAYTSITITISALAGSRTVAGAGAFGLFVFFYIGIEMFVTSIGLLLNFDILPDSDWVIELVFFVISIDPGNAFSNAVVWSSTALNPDEEATAALEQFYDGSLPFYIQDWFGPIVLLAWIVIPIAIAIYHFEGIDL